MAETARLTDPLDGARVLPDKTIGNGPTRDDLLFFMGQFRSADAKIAEAKAIRKRFRSRAKLLGIDLQQFDLAIHQFDLEDDTTLDQLKTFKRYCEMLELPIGSQMQLFDTPNSEAPSQEGLLKKAYQSGYDNGLLGKNPDEQAYPPMTPEGQEHLKGWNDAQNVLLSKLKTLDDEPEPAPKKTRKKNGEGDTVN